MRAPISYFLVLSLLTSLVLPSCNSAPDKRLLQYMNTSGFGNRYVGNAEEENYVSIGDTVRLFDSLHPNELTASQRVDIDGTIMVPEIGAVVVAGNTRSELEALLTEKYSQYYDETDIKVSIRTKGKKYFVFGEVRMEGEVRFNGDMTIFEAVMRAVPDKATANLGRVRLIRADPVDPLIIPINVADMIETGDSSFNIAVHERDIIFVPPTMLARIGYFVNDLLAPFNIVLSGISGAFFGYGNRGRRGGGGTSSLFGFF
jgi:protein involved in polysaccharide export with SLBB domain